MEKARLNISASRPSGTSVVTLEKGKIPPQALDFEEAVLGALMIDKRAIDKVIDVLGKGLGVFYRDAHNVIYDAVVNLYEAGEPVDLLTVSNALRQAGILEGVGGDYYLVSLTQKVTSSAHLDYHTHIIFQKYIQRELIKISTDIIDNSYDETTDVFDLMESAETKLFNITNNNFRNDIEKADTLVIKALKNIEELSKQEGGMSGIPSGFRDIDRVTSGWQKSDLIIVAARPGMGKTAFVVSMAKNIAIKHDIPVALFSLEMPSIQLISRMISSETSISSDKLRQGKLREEEWKVLHEKVKNLEKAPIYIDDTPALSISDFRSKCRRLVNENKVKIFIIDYLQLMTAGGSAGNREQEISTISRNLKAVAKELNVPIIALSQLSRAVETQSGSKRPMLSHLRESGAIEQDADIVSFIYRPEYYGIKEWDDDDRSPTEGQAEYIIAKHRNGSLENIRMKFVGRLALFTDMDEGFNTDFSASDVFASKINAGPVTSSDAFDPADGSTVFQSNINGDEEVPF